MPADIARNTLDSETSPYLLQHKDNPVHWQAWGPDVLAAARESGKPILLSVGYAACHWCHVMAHESFERPETAAVMNRHFVNIKVDREERPDIDSIYQTALSLQGEHGGWPLTMFLTPEGEPFWGGTYFPPEPRWGRPGFVDLLARVAEVYAGDPAMVARNRDALRRGLAETAAPPAPPAGPVAEITPALLDRISDRLLGEIDREHGGIGGAPKFPQTAILALLWRAHLRRNNADCGDAVILTLERMCQGGIYDHLGGGFARYSTDAAWLVPHFEKMLYDNALLIDLLTCVQAETGSPLLRQRLYETVGWVLREMRTAEGAFAASQDADSEGHEGRFYVWSEAEIDRLLGADSAAFKEVYGVTAGGNWEGSTILNRTPTRALLAPAAEEDLERSRQILFAARETRIKPGWDDKALADWNGLMITALARAGAALAEPGWIAACRQAFAAIENHMMTADGRLRHSFRAGRAHHSALLDDYAALAQAALALYEVTGDAPYLARAEALVETLDRHYWDSDSGGYFFTADDAEALISRRRQATDNATPNGNAVALEVQARLYHLTGEDRYRLRAEALITAFSGEVGRNFFPLASFLNAAEFFYNPVQIVVIGRRGDSATDALIRVALASALPDRVLQVVAPGTGLPPHHPAQGKTDLAGPPAAYVCIGASCSLPVRDAAALVASLSST